MQSSQNDQKGQELNAVPGKLPSVPSAVELQKDDDYSRRNLLQIPTINTPKGGGALKSIDEKFQVNGANGTTALGITIPLSKSRNDFAPGLSLTYNSGSGNSPFGLGWNISLPSIRRRTDKLLPQYQDAANSDIFQIAGAEDLVVRLQQDNRGNWHPDQFATGNYQIKRFIPRVEGAFTLIEQVQSPAGLYWKTTSKDNTVIFFGISPAGRVADPADPTRIFEWLPEICYDDKGNCYQYFYVAENLVNVPRLLHEGNRLNGNQAIANTYLKRAAFGNTTPYSPTPSGGTPDPYNPVIPDGTGYLFNLVLDYGDHDLTTPTPTPSGEWGCRLDAFSNGKPGFDMRTYRLCRRFLMFHLFPELDSHPVLVRSLNLAYQYYDFQPVTDPYLLPLVEADFITSVTETGWTGTAGGGYLQTSFPAVTFGYQLPVWNTTVETIPAQNRMNIPEGLSATYQFTDLYNEGISGILSEQSDGWYYNSNLGDGLFTPANLIAPKPSFTGLSAGTLQLQSLAGDGRKFIVSTAPLTPGYFELTDETEQWLPFMAFEKYPAVDLKDPNIKFIDLNGDGMPDVVLSEEQVFTWYPAAGISGYDSPERAPKGFDEEKGPAIVFADAVQSIFLADMSGDGLTDIVRIRNGEISYWPNLGYGIFGAKVNMLNAPEFDTIDAFNPAYLHLADINGTGATDILYLGRDRLRAWLNLSGNAWGSPFEMPAFPHTAFPNQVAVADFLGNGTSCIVWSSPLAGNTDEPMQYVDLMGGKKPYLMKDYSNGMGKTVALAYRSSTYYYLQDKLAGSPWITKLCFPVQCVANVLVTDSVSGTSYSSSYTYHHGYFDHPEKEYRGFGRVDQTDTDVFDTNAVADQAPVLTRTWYHTGAYFGLGRMLHQFAAEYFQNPYFTEYTLPEPELPPNLTAEEVQEAVRVCKGMVLRQEVYAMDMASNPGLATIPYNAAEHNNTITLVQPQGPNPYAVFLSLQSETIGYQYERNPADPRIAHTLNTAFDQYGNVIDSFAVVYPRQAVTDSSKPGGMALPGNQSLPAAVMEVQENTYIAYTHHRYTGPIITSSTYRLPLPCEAITYQVAVLPPIAGNFYRKSDFVPAPALSRLTKLSHQRRLFLQDDLVTPLSLGAMDTLGFSYQEYHLGFNADVTALAGKATTALMQAANYIESDAMMAVHLFPASDATGEWWVPSGQIIYLKGGAPMPFLLPYQYLDAFGYPMTIAYDAHFLFPASVTDALNNVSTAGPIDYRALFPLTVTDANGNATDYRYDGLGLLVGIALRGKGEGDSFNPGWTADLTAAQVTAFFSDPHTNGPALLQGATTRYVYNFVAGGPYSTGTITRQKHANQTADPRVDTTSVPYQYSFDYTDGLGRTAMKKVMADPFTGPFSGGSCSGTGPPGHQWIGKGKTVYNNKGKPVMQYEPYFSPTPAYEAAPVNGVTPVLHYDPVGRAIRTDFPDGSFSQTNFDAWVEMRYDQNDTVKDSNWYTAFSNSSDPKDQDAAAKALVDYNTPSSAHLDPLGRNFYTVSYNIVGGIAAFYSAQTVLDLNNNPLAIIDAMGNTVMQWDYDLLNRSIHQVSMDAGEHWILHDCMNKPDIQWDQNGANTFIYSYTYDQLHRTLQSNVQINGIPYIAAYNIYGEGISINGAADTANNLRGRQYRQFDGSGLVTNYLYDFKGNPVQASRIYATAFRAANPIAPPIPWAGTAADMGLLTGEEYMTLTAYDALNRVMLRTRAFLPTLPGHVIPPPYDQTAVNGADVMTYGYGESGYLTSENLYYGGGGTATPYVVRICHNERGQRLCIQLGNNTVTRYTYDPGTFRLIRLLTTANAGITILQDINNYYDPVGNITYAIDKAQPAISFGGQQVLADADYTYDPLYRLTRATGREQIAQNTMNENAGNTDYRNFPYNAISPLPAPTDALAMRPYTQIYQYDPAGNLTRLQHVAGTGSYTRTFAYNNNAADRATYLVPAGAPLNNQMIATILGAASPERYSYDGHGNMTNLVQLASMAWNFKDELVSTTQQVVTTGTGQTTYYNYDAKGTRTRKVTLSAAAAGGTPSVIAERLYIGGFEIFRSLDNLGNISLQRETLHVMDDIARIATIDKKTIDATGSDATKLNTYYPRFQYSNHLNSSLYELDETAAIITYEEYHPFGTTSFQAADGQLDVPPKRYRYAGKERDEESGLYYYGARYYAPWLCRWIAADRTGIRDGLNLYSYSQNNPSSLFDQGGRWTVSWKDVAIGAGIAALTIVAVGAIIITAGAAAPAIAAAAAAGLGASAATVATVVVTTEVVVTVGTTALAVKGVVDTAGDVQEVATGVDPHTGRQLSDQARSRLLGATAVGVVATIIGARSLLKGGGRGGRGGGSGEVEINTGSGSAAPEPVGSGTNAADPNVSSAEPAAAQPEATPAEQAAPVEQGAPAEPAVSEPATPAEPAPAEQSSSSEPNQSTNPAGRRVYRGMKGTPEGPQKGDSGRTLGINKGGKNRASDVTPDAQGNVGPGSGGMSVAPDTPLNLPTHRRPASLGTGTNGEVGTGPDPVWELNVDDLPPELQFTPDKGANPTHGVIEPSENMSVDDLQSSLQSTQPLWTPVEPPPGK